MNIAAFFTTYPLHKSVQDNPNWAAEANGYIGNGPFKMKSWKHSDSIELVPNENYWDKDSIKLTTVKFMMIKDANTELNLYKAGQLDWAGNPTGNIPAEQLAKFRAEKTTQS